MNLKKSLILLYFLGLLPLSCIVKGQKDKYFTITDIKLEVYQDKWHQTKRNESDKITTDSLFIKFKFTPTYMAISEVNLGWQNHCQATKVPPPGYLGLKTKLKAINFFSDSDFNGKTKGNDLSEFIYYNLNGKINDQSGLQSMIDYMNGSIRSQYYNYNECGFCFIRKPSGSKKHQFTIELIYESGEVTKSNIDLIWR